MITFNYDSENKTLTCQFAANMDSRNCSEAIEILRDKLAELIPSDRPETQNVLFDLTGVDYASSLFLRMVLMTVKRVHKDHFSIINENQFIADMFKTAALDQLLNRSGNIECHLQETRVFPPPPEFAAASAVKSMDEYRTLHRESLENPEAFWGKQANEQIEWFEPWKKVLEWNLPNAKWFTGGKLNVSYNCLDKHLGTPLANKAAIIWEGEPETTGPGGDERVITYRQLHRMVCMFANVLKRHGVGKGDRVLIYLPMVAEAAVVGRADDVKGFAVVAFVTLISGETPSPELREELRIHVGHEVSAVARPDEIRFAGALPKTRSGKIMRRRNRNYR